MPREQPKPKPIWEVPPPHKAIPGIFRSYNLAFYPWLRKGQGVHAYRYGLCTLILMFVYAGAAPCPELLYYMPVWLLLVLLRRPDRAAGSTYAGRSIFGRWGESKGRMIEPVFVGAVGVALLDYSEALGLFVIGGAVSLLAWHSVEIGEINRMRINMTDAQTQAWRMSRISKGGDGFE
jgi:hypothetical protein